MNLVFDWLGSQLTAPGALGSLIEAAAILAVMFSLGRQRRLEIRRLRAERSREAAALVELADHSCDLLVEVADALRDEVNAHEFVESFDRRQLIDADLMLEAIPVHALPALSLLRPLFELRWSVERGLEIADWLAEIIVQTDRENWRETAAEMKALAERAAVAADAFRRYRRDTLRS